MTMIGLEQFSGMAEGSSLQQGPDPVLLVSNYLETPTAEEGFATGEMNGPFQDRISRFLRDNYLEEDGMLAGVQGHHVALLVPGGAGPEEAARMETFEATVRGALGNQIRYTPTDTASIEQAIEQATPQDRIIAASTAMTAGFVAAPG